MITGVLSAKHGYFNYYAELETAGKCFDWVINHLALDEVGIYLKSNKVTDESESRYISIYDYLSEVISKVPPGANGVIFTPWMHGNRCPFEDSNAGGLFFNALEYCRQNGIKRLINTISYGDVAKAWRMDPPVDESEPRSFNFTGDHAVYIISKNAASDLAEYYNQQHGMKNAWFRFPPVYGVGPHGYLKVNGWIVKSGLQIFIDKAKAGEDIEVFGYWPTLDVETLKKVHDKIDSGWSVHL